MDNQQENEITASTVKSMMWSTLQDLKSRKIKPDMANAMSKGLNVIVGVVRLEAEVAKTLNTNTVSLDNFINSNGVQPKNYLSTEEQERKALEGQDVQGH